MTAPTLNIFQQAPHAVLPIATHDERSRQEFAKSLKGFVQGSLLPGLAPVYAGRAARAFAAEAGRAPADRHDIRRAMTRDLYFQHYAATNRIAQELLWDSILDSLDHDLPRLQAAADQLSANATAPLETSPDFETPRYVTALDIHCMPGGYATELAPGDVAAGALYDRGVYLYAMGYMGPDNDDMGRSVTRYVRRTFPDFAPQAILDMGCTVGHSTLPYKEAFPDAAVTGIDVGGPCVRYAHARAAAKGVEVGFLQRNAEATGLADASFDLIVSHILLHETSGKAMPAIFRECFRLLRPGGLMIHADLPPFDRMDPFSQFILDNETWYNNEPFWGAMRELDQLALARAAGFPDAWFDTAPMAIMEAEPAGTDAGPAGEAAGPPAAEVEFTAGEFGAKSGWEVLIARKPA
jgi:SAM-dependent methyltransferase